jgi:integrase/recombinase XerD
MSTLASSLQAWFTDRLIRERNASPHTIASYRDTIRLLLTYASQRLEIEPSQLDLGQLDARLVGAFLEHLETDRGCSARTRNTRLATIRTFYRYCLLRHPEHAATIERVLQIGPKRHERALVTYLTEPELDALIDAPDRSSWTGRRDYAIITLLAQTGLRASELTGLACGDIHLGTGAHVATTGKGRKQRITPLTKGTVKNLAGASSAILARGCAQVLTCAGVRVASTGAQRSLYVTGRSFRVDCPATCFGLQRKMAASHRSASATSAKPWSPWRVCLSASRSHSPSVLTTLEWHRLALWPMRS